ncbi:S-layer homology domain-containing protein [Paenibacillus aestuarii]|uniref:S-layer homology domain-containing protein n=1 Tax=Paenibacillus aestuarii TaxID=516965 RepID=A0ABW0KDN6_9BACL|nr:S-layer homology domain-containing protein [Paenibacillus aestuarii]
MKNTLKTIALTAAALSMLSSTAFAANSSADFTDLNGIDAGLKAKIDAMVSAGIFEGVSNDTFGIDQNMTRAQFAKVATLIYGINVDTSVKVSSFSDVKADDPANGWAIPYIEAAKKAGLIDGVTDTTFIPGDSVTTGQLDTVLLKGLGKKVNVSGTPWFADAVKQATDLGIHAAGKAGDQAATRADLVQSSYAAQQAFNDQNQTLVSVTGAQASSDLLKVTVTLNKQVDTSKATLALNKDTSAVNTTTEWAADGKSATLTITGGALAAGNYTVTLGGLDASTIKTATATFTVTTTPVSDGNIAVDGDYTIANVIDSGLTATAPDQASAEDPTKSMLAKEIKIKVKNAAGDDVAVPGIVQSVHSSDSSIAKVGLSADHHAYVIGNKVGTAVVTVMVQIGNNDPKQLSVTVNVKSDAVTASTMKADNTSFDRTMTVTGGVYSDIFDAFNEMKLKVTDNYGIEYENSEVEDYNFALGNVFTVTHISGDDAQGAVGTVTVDTNGIVRVSGNVKSFELNAVSPTGKTATSFVTMKRP